MDEYDVVVIGGGPGGYVAAIRAAQLGYKVACVECWVNHHDKPALGGTCLNVGCIPSKALLDSSHHLYYLQHGASKHGIIVGGASINIEKMMAHKTKIIDNLTLGIAGLLRKNKIAWLLGKACIMANKQIKISPTHAGHDNEAIISAKHIIIATGSVPAPLAAAKVDHENIIDSTGALSFKEIPKKLGIIGAGVIGLELGSVWQRLGSKVTIFEALPEFLPNVDRQIAKEAYKILSKQGLDIHFNTRVTGTASNRRQVTVNHENDTDQQQTIVDKLIVAIGRSPNTDGLVADDVDLAMSDKGFILVNEHNETNITDIYAIGDVIGGAMLAHKASEEGVVVAEHIAGQSAHLDYRTIPWVIYTAPEIAWVGKTEQMLKQEDTAYNVGIFPMIASGRAQAMGETTGMVKLLADKTTDQLLGAHIISANASELIAEAVTVMAFEGSAEDIARTIHAHPSLSEVIHEAALNVNNRAIHV